MRKNGINERPSVIRASEVEPTNVDWLMPGFVPFGTPSRLDGNPGVGKTTVAMDFAARCTNADEMPDLSVPLDEPADVLILSAEDSPGDLQRRLVAAGGDLDRVHIVSSDDVAFPEGASWLEDTINEIGAKLVVVDPFMGYLSGDLDSHRDHGVRRALRPLTGVAERTGAAILLIGHLNKSDGRIALHRTGGSIGLMATCRVAMLAAEDPSMPGHCLLAVTKTNLGQRPDARRFCVESDGTDEAGRIAWGDSVPLTSDELLTGHSHASKSADAKLPLLEILADQDVPAKEIIEEGRCRDIGQRTLEAAKDNLGVSSHRIDTADGHHYVWRLPRSATPKASNSADLNRSAGFGNVVKRTKSTNQMANDVAELQSVKKARRVIKGAGTSKGRKKVSPRSSSRGTGI